ncbi:MAG: flagellar hook assembly protein FlgD [Caulobacteraceae bacterium]|nr:flagellar hook assembly protein FlgD [Caulobacteraceae bacterium]
MANGIASIGQAQATISNGSSMLGQNYETFLSLLTAQLKNQDPTAPVDSNAFTAQLVQMSGVEQQLLTNQLLTSLVSQGASGMTSGVSYIGKQVTASFAATELQDGKANWSYELANDATDVKLEIVDSTGKTVWSGQAPDRSAGIHDFVWDGRNSAGVQLPDGGVYTLKITSKNGAGADVASQVLTRGIAKGVEMYNGAAYVTIGGAIVPLSSIISVETPPAAGATG